MNEEILIRSTQPEKHTFLKEYARNAIKRIPQQGSPTGFMISPKWKQTISSHGAKAEKRFSIIAKCYAKSIILLNPIIRRRRPAMRYFLISDVHGEYDKMIDALAKAGFDETQDTLVMVGDAIDRGQDSENVIDYLLSLSNKILLWGNHEARFLNLLNGASIESYDFHNCTTDTIAQLGAKGK